MAQSEIVIPARFCGPPDCGNGGYSAGAVASLLDADTVTVKLLAPMPLDLPLQVQSFADKVSLHNDETKVIEAWASELELQVPHLQAVDKIDSVRQRCQGFRNHPFPGCFVCGPDRQQDGLAVYPGPLTDSEGQALVAARWQAQDEFYDAENQLDKKIIWAALDCPTSFAALEITENQALVPMVLGLFTVRILKPIYRHDAVFVQAWAGAKEGRKVKGYSALVSTSGECFAYSEALWISIKK